MTHIPTTSINHLRLTVTDLERSRRFYTQILGFHVAAESPPDQDDPASRAMARLLFGGVVLRMANGVLFGLRPVAPGHDRFDEDRVGLDHLSFDVDTRDDLERAAALLDRHGVPHSAITDLGPAFGIHVLVFRDPDNIQLELTAPR